jgi:hypothetical protein
MVLDRYARFMAVTQNVDPDRASTYLPLRAYHPLWDLLRIRFILLPAPGGISVREMDRAIPRVQLLTDWKTVKTEREACALLTDPAFDPRQTVILEREPGISPSHPGAAGTCSIRDDGSDRLLVRAETSRPALLLIAENYSTGWQVVPLGSAPQPSYAILAADRTLMAVPLAPGKHAFAVLYRPRAFLPGAWLSLAAWAFLGAWGLWRRVPRLCRRRDGCRKEDGAGGLP